MQISCAAQTAITAHTHTHNNNNNNYYYYYYSVLTANALRLQGGPKK